MALYCQLPAHRGLDLIARTPGAEVWRQAQARQLFNGLVGWPVFPKPDGVMGVNHNLPRFHQSRHACGVTGVFHKHQEGGGVGDKSPVMSDTVGNGGHAELAYAIVNIVSGDILFQRCRARPDGQVAGGQIRRAAQQLRQDWANRIQGVLRCLTGGDFGRVRLQVFNQRLRFLFPVLR